MADQKELKKRLKVLMQKPENQICSDCPERQPRWASLIVPPPGSPPGSSAIGAFCCLECSGSHRRLGVHISFVRSINLDSWKEKEVLAMENGGNRKVNAIWEANLERVGGRKPTTGADLNTRERYIRDKYERRRFYDPQALVDYENSLPSVDELVTRDRGGNDFANFGEGQVSAAAAARAEKKKKKTIKKTRSFETSATNKSSGSDGAARRRTKKQEPEPVADLLDFGGVVASPAPNSQPAANGDFADFLAPSAPADAERDPRSRSNARTDMRTKSKTPDREKTRKNQQQDILNMYNAPLGGQTSASANNNAMNTSNQTQMMAMMQQMQQMSMNPQQQQMFGAGQSAPNNAGGGKHNQRLAMHQNLQMNQMQHMQQQQSAMQNMQKMMMQQGMNPNMMQNGGMNPNMLMQGGMNPNIMLPGGMNNNNNNMMTPQMMQAMMNASMQAAKTNNGGMMPNNGNMGMNPNMMGGAQAMANGGGGMAMNPNMMGGMGQVNPNMMMGMNNPMAMQQMGQLGGISVGNGAGVGSSSGKTQTTNTAPEKEDPFASFGMNAFR